MKCVACRGTGLVEVEYMGGSSDGGPWGLMMPPKPCSDCGGRGW